MPVRHPAIPEPTVGSAESVRDAILTIKESMEILTGQKRNGALNKAVTWQDLVDLGIVAEDQVP